jgi:hypothetical protein
MSGYLIELFEAASLWRAERRRERYEQEVRREAEESIRYRERQHDVNVEICKMEKAKREAEK